MYSNNKEYRQVLRNFFQMNITDQILPLNIDEETLDEQMYDSNAVNKKMNEIFTKTKSIDAFVHLYEIAAGHMFSTDLETGLAVLLSYDYFPLFYSLYQKINDNNNTDFNTDFLELTKEYENLLNRIKPNKNI